MKRHQLLMLLFMLLSVVMTAQKNSIVVKPVTTELRQAAEDKIQYLTPLAKPSKYFLDKTPVFVLELPDSHIPATATSLDAKVGGEEFSFTTVPDGLYIENTGAGEIEIELFLKDLSGNPVSFAPGAKSKLGFKTIKVTPWFKNDAIVIGILLIVLALIFWTESLPQFKGFYRIVPSLLLCYFVPAILNSLGIISGASSSLYYVSSRYFLPASLVLLCLSIDFKGIVNLGPKALVMFFAATLGIVIGGPIALMVVLKFFPGLLHGESVEIANGLATIAGSWIGGGANQTAMKEIFEVKDNLFASMIIVDVVVANIWMGILLYGVSISDKVDEKLKADNSAIRDLVEKAERFKASIMEIPNTRKVFIMLAVAFGAVALSHWGASVIVPAMKSNKETLVAMGLQSLMSSFFWIVVIATTAGLLLSLTKAKKLEGYGASRWGSVFIYILVASIGMKMDLGEIFNNLGLFAVGFIWIIIHVTVLLLVAKLIRAPFFFVAVGSQANIGGAASAPIVASAFNPALAPVGVLMAVLGYALGTYMALVCAFMMQAIAGG